MKKIIIIDDSAELLEVLKFFLEKNDYKVLTFTHLGNIIDEIKNFLPDLVILDIHIGGVDGREICLELKKNNDFKNLCIMLFSSSPELLKDYELCEANDILEKPFNLSLLLKKVRDILNVCNQNTNQ